jgi:hypothetical protein
MSFDEPAAGCRRAIPPEAEADIAVGDAVQVYALDDGRGQRGEEEEDEGQEGKDGRKPAEDHFGRGCVRGRGEKRKRVGLVGLAARLRRRTSTFYTPGRILPAVQGPLKCVIRELRGTHIETRKVLEAQIDVIDEEDSRCRV